MRGQNAVILVVVLVVAGVLGVAIAGLPEPAAGADVVVVIGRDFRTGPAAP